MHSVNRIMLTAFFALIGLAVVGAKDSQIRTSQKFEETKLLAHGPECLWIAEEVIFDNNYGQGVWSPFILTKSGYTLLLITMINRPITEKNLDNSLAFASNLTARLIELGWAIGTPAEADDRESQSSIVIKAFPMKDYTAFLVINNGAEKIFCSENYLLSAVDRLNDCR